VAAAPSSPGAGCRVSRSCPGRCRRLRVAVESRGVPRAARGRRLLPAPSAPRAMEMMSVEAGGQPGVPAAVGGLGEVRTRAVAVFVCTRRVLARCPPSRCVPRAQAEGAPAQRELCARGRGSGQAAPLPRVAGQAAACVATSPGTWDSLGQSPPPLLEMPSTTPLLAVFRELWGAWVWWAAPESAWWATSPCIPLLLEQMAHRGPFQPLWFCVWHCWRLSHAVEPRRGVSGAAALALLQGLGRTKQARVRGKGWCGAPAPGQPRTVPAAVSVLSRSGWCHPLCRGSSWRREAGDPWQHFGKVNTVPGLVLPSGRPSGISREQWESPVPSTAVVLGSLSCHGGISDCRALQPASLTALITWLMEDGLEGGWW